MRLPKLRKKVFFVWLASYLIIILLSVAICVAIVSNVSKALYTEIENVSFASLDKFKSIIDSKLYEINIVAFKTATEYNIRKVYSSQDLYSDINALMAVRSLKEALLEERVYNESITDILLITKKNRMILSGQFGKLHEELLENDRTRTFGLTVEQFFEYAESNARYYIIPGVGENADKQLLISYPIWRQNSIEAVLVAKVDLDKIIGFVRDSEEFSNAGLFIIDQFGNYINVLDTKAVLDISPETAEIYQNGLLNPDAISSRNKTAKDFVIQSGTTQFTYLLTYDMNDYFVKVDRVRIFSLIILFAFFFLGLVVSIILAKYNYLRIGRIIEKVRGFLPQYSLMSTNELLFLESSVDKLLLDNQGYYCDLEYQKNTIVKSTLVQLLKGYYLSFDDIKDIVLRNEFWFQTDAFVVAAVRINQWGKLVENEPDKSNKLCCFILQNIIQEILNKNQKLILLDLDSVYVAVINVDPDNPDSLEQVTNVFEEAIDIMERNFDVRLKAALSTVCRSIYELNSCYREAHIGLEQLTEDKADTLIRYSDLNVDLIDKRAGKHRLENIHKMVNSLMAENFSQAEKIALDILDDDYKCRTSGNDENRMRKHSITNLIAVAIHSICDEQDGEAYLKRAEKLIDDLMHTDNIVELKKIITSLFAILYDFQIEKESIVHNNERVNEIIDYIHANYADANLSVVKISEHVDLSSAHITRLLRGKTGLGTLEYIQKVRIESAKNLLARTDQNVNTIAKRVGYINYRTMNYVFKKLEGITATQYREQAESQR